VAVVVAIVAMSATEARDFKFMDKGKLDENSVK
jgi:hypothetical protein